MLRLKNYAAVLLLSIVLSGAGSAAWATQITLPIVPGLLLLAAPQTATVGGASTDGANFFFSSTMPDIAFENAAVRVPNNGTRSAAVALARPPVIGFPAFTATSAETKPGMNETSAVFAIATAGATIRASVAIKGMFNLQIDPFLVNEGDASASMAFQLLFNGQDLFSASATLTNGTLTPSGAFSFGDFDVDVIGPRTIAELTNISFLVPFDIPASAVGQDLPFEFNQTFNARAMNGGFAQASSVPEATSLLLLIIGMVSLLVFGRGRRLTYRPA